MQKRNCFQIALRHFLMQFSMFISASVLFPISMFHVDSQHITMQDGDPWEDAVQKAKVVLSEQPNFVANLQSYQATAQEINTYFGYLEEARPALDIIDDLKGMDLVVGNAWDILVDALDAVTPGAGEALVYVDDGLRELLRLKGKLDSLNILQPMIDAVSAFQANPTKQTLIDWDQACGTASVALGDVDSEIMKHIKTLEDVIESISTAQTALFGIGDLVGLESEVSQLNQGISSLTNPIYQLDDSIQALHQQIQDDLGVMQEIGLIVEEAKNPSSAASPASSIGSTISSNWWLIVLGLAVIAGAVFIAIGLSKRRKLTVGAGLGGAIVEVDERSIDVEVAEERMAVSFTPARLTATSGPRSGDTIQIDHDNFRLGRGSTSDLRLLDRSVSRSHALLRFAEGAWFLQDQGSAGGTIVNDQLVTARKLKSGDRIQIGESIFIYQVED